MEVFAYSPAIITLMVTAILINMIKIVDVSQSPETVREAAVNNIICTAALCYSTATLAICFNARRHANPPHRQRINETLGFSLFVGVILSSFLFITQGLRQAENSISNNSPFKNKMP